ncbi:MAG TPA: hypothetical protein VHZ24_23070 [Pirellulales bacterium]|nr:hypothetical protein [Pirellulales bacterium]
MSDDGTNSRPSLTAPLWAAARQGGKEFAPILKAFPDSIGIVEEPGTIGNPTAQLVTQEIRGGDSTFDQLLDAYGGRGQGHDGQERGVNR